MLNGAFQAPTTIASYKCCVCNLKLESSSEIDRRRDWNLEEHATLRVWWGQPTRADIHLERRVQEAWCAEHGVALLAPRDEVGLVRAELEVLVRRALVCDGRPARLVAILRVVVPDEEAVVFGEREQALHGLHGHGERGDRGICVGTLTA